MDDRKNKALQEKPILLDLESLYLGIPDESVNLTFQDLADVNTLENRKPNSIIATTELATQVSNNNLTKATLSPSHSLTKIPSLDFSKGLEASNQHHHHHHRQDIRHGDTPWGHFGRSFEGNRGHLHDPQFSHVSRGAKSSPQPRAGGDDPRHLHDHQFSNVSGGAKSSSRPRASGDDRSGYSMSYDDMSMASSGRGGGRRRPGIPHSKICTICSTYVYVFRTRCLVCGRVYCCRCVKIGMGEMVEGRKCIECLGLKFSQRYIEKAGKVGCCNWRHPRTLKQAELICAEKGPRRSRRSSYGQSGIANSTSRNPISPINTHAIASNEHSFVLSSTFSPFSPHHNNLPF